MLTLPIPVFVALILGFIALRHLVLRDRSWLFLALLAACALQSVIISLTQHYGLRALDPVQPVTAVFAPVLAWLAFRTAAFEPLKLPRDGVHVLAPALVAFCVAFAPLTLDGVIPLLYLAYGGAMLVQMRREDSLPLVRLDAGPLPGRVWRAMAWLLILSALSDVLIALAFGFGQGWLRPIIVSVFTSFTLCGLGLLSMSPHVEAVSEPDAPAAPDPAPTSEAEAALIARLDAMMTDAQLYLDPDLTLSRLARKLHVPIKQLSTTINRTKGENVSRYVNGFRVRHAYALLEAGESVTEAMLASGFNTKSNFNREFLRVTGKPPSQVVRAEGSPDGAGSA